MATFGYSDFYSTDHGDASTLAAFPATLSQNGTVSKLTVRLSNSRAGHIASEMKGAIYAKSGGSPGALLAYSNAVTIPDNYADAELDLPLTSSTYLTAGDYYLCWALSSLSDISIMQCYEAGTGSVACASYTYPTLPDPFGATVGYFDYMFYIYATYTTGGGGAPVVSGVGPASGPVSGGTAVTISGSGFTGATQVAFGQRVLTSGFTVANDTTITVNSPPGIG